jgi:hypothetical protein
MLDFGTVSFPFTEFPKGVDVTLYDDKGKDESYCEICGSIQDNRNHRFTRKCKNLLKMVKIRNNCISRKNEWFIQRKV